MHEAHATGEFFLKMENLDHHAICPECGVVESIEHIMLECQIPAAEEVWRTAKRVWEEAGEEWPSVNYDIILGCGLTRPAKKTKMTSGRNRLFSKLISEGSLLIWKLRNERRLQKADDESKYHSLSEIRNRFISIIEITKQTDITCTNVGRFGKKAIPRRIVQDTWSKEEETSKIPYREWVERAQTEQAGVLVSSGMG